MKNTRNLISFVSLLVAMMVSAGAGAQDGLIYHTEGIAGSDIPVTYHLVSTDDGLLTPIGLRKPDGDGPFPVVLFSSGNGGEGYEYIKDYSHNRGWTLEQFLSAGYAVAWLRYRSEVEVPVYGKESLVAQPWSGRPVFNRAPLEYEDAIRIIDYVRALPYVDSDRVGWMGVSHAGEMLMKITSVYGGLAAGIASEPASAGFMARGEVASVPEIGSEEYGEDGMSALETADSYDAESLRVAVKATHEAIDREIVMARINPIDTPIFVQGRSRDHNQPVFRVNYELLSEAGKTVEWKSYDHDVHGFVYVGRDSAGNYAPDEVQREAIFDSLAFFDRYMK
jgi:dienelactone hydrolase